LKALVPLLADPKRPKIVPRPEAFQLLAGRAANIRHATQIYSFCCGPDREPQFLRCGHAQFNAMMGGRFPASAPTICSGWRPHCTRKSRSTTSKMFTKKWICRSRQVIAELERNGIRVDPKELGKMSQTMEREIRRLEKEIWKLAGSEFNVNSPTQLAEILFDKLEFTA